jgi:hypothetical protein
MLNMQPIESLMFFTFVLSYSFTALRSLLWPEQMRINEIRFFSSSNLYPSDTIVLGLASIASAAMIGHLWIEGFVLGQIILYLNLLFFLLLSAAHWTNFFRRKKLEKARAAHITSYKAAGIRRLALTILMIILPITFPR